MFVLLAYGHGWAQCTGVREFYQRLLAVEKDTSLRNNEKLVQVMALKESYKNCHGTHDSVYARMLYRIGVLNKNSGKINEAIYSLRESIQANAKEHKGYNRQQAIFSFYTLGILYLDQNFYTEALSCFDNCIAEGKDARDSALLVRVSSARQKKGFIYHQWGDDQKNAVETKLGLRTALQSRNSAIIVDLFNGLAQAYASMQMIPAALACLDSALYYIPAVNSENAYADNYKQRAMIHEANGQPAAALQFYQKAISTRTATKKETDLAKDYLDAGNLLMRESANHPLGKVYYQKALLLASKNGDGELAGKVLNNMGAVCSKNKQYTKALEDYHRSLVQLTPSLSADPLRNPAYHLCNAVNKLFLYQVLANKTQCLLDLYKQTGRKKFVTACLQTALLTDSVMNGMRRAQTEEQSKLRWLGDARDLFANALEACYLAGNDTLAFYFMEKSRSVLLSEKLNEIGASAVLPPAEAEKEKESLLRVLSEQQQLARLVTADPQFAVQEGRYLEAMDAFENYTRGLQASYPAYYAYKYADDVPQLPAFQQYLARTQQCFVHYFFSDSTYIYMLVTTSDSISMIRQPVKDKGLPLRFLQLCADQSGSNKNYPQLTLLSSQLYRLLFQPLHLPMKRVVICNDTYLLPFEALMAGKDDFLINQYVFSYAYSARSLLKKFDNPAGSGDCLLVAPAQFAAGLGVSRLDGSEKFIRESGAYYRDSKVLMHTKATKKNFLKLFHRYKIVSVYSHATADHHEPLLYMQDDSIPLSELQALDRPSTQLVILSACQTGVGKNAAGEGVYSLARGFAAAGVPSITSTLWEADANAMYAITKGFHQRISQGMRKDDALQQAKLAYMQEQERPRPYYWATMVLVGNPEPIELAPLPPGTIAPLSIPGWVWMLAGALVLLAVSVWIWKKKSGKQVVGAFELSQIEAKRS
ncbi:MAG: CHAT domain-containing protein [Williamsia sp.]|nr:CHAT domain-containing protein [Williamsia sp.]